MSTITVTTTDAWRNGYWNAAGGSEYPILAGTAALAVATLAAAPLLVIRARNLRQPASNLVAINSTHEVA